MITEGAPTHFGGSQGWTGVVLAGGKSSRMGRDKAMIEFEGRTLLDRALDTLQPHVDDLMVIGDPVVHGYVGPFVIADDMPGLGPLGGIVTALRYAIHDRVIIMACDMPGVNSALIQHLKHGSLDRQDAFIPQCDGHLEPLVAIYHRRCRSVFEACIAEGRWKVADALERVKATYAQVCAGEGNWPKDLFRNINAPGDL